MPKVAKMPRGPRGQRTLWLRRQVLGLAAGCPILRTNPENCPLFELRHMDKAGRVGWIRGLKIADLEYLVAYHAVCAQVRGESAAVSPAPV